MRTPAIPSASPFPPLCLVPCLSRAWAAPSTGDSNGHRCPGSQPQLLPSVSRCIRPESRLGPPAQCLNPRPFPQPQPLLASPTDGISCLLFMLLAASWLSRQPPTPCYAEKHPPAPSHPVREQGSLLHPRPIPRDPGPPSQVLLPEDIAVCCPAPGFPATQQMGPVSIAPFYRSEN